MWEGGPLIDCKIEVNTDAKSIKVTPYWFDLITVPSGAYSPKPPYKP